LEPKIILLLGSYDEQTRAILNAVKVALAKEFSGEELYCFLIIDLEVFSDAEYGVIVEQYDFPSSTAFIFDNNAKLLDVIEIQFADAFNLQPETEQHLNEWCIRNGRNISSGLNGYSFFNALDNLFRFAKMIVLIRDREETKGGEYVDLTFGAAKHADKFTVLYNAKIELSGPTMALMERYNIDNSKYTDQEDLVSILVREVRKHCC
jgi:hypothetical protein